MKSKMLRGLCVAVVSFMLAIPVYAHAATTNGGNGGLGNGMGTGTGTGTHSIMHDGISTNRHSNRVYVQSKVGSTSTKAMTDHGVSVYGTGTGSQFLNANANPSSTMDRNPDYRTHTYSNDGYRALETTSPRGGIGWGWLGLIGLLGLFGIRSRNPQRNR